MPPCLQRCCEQGGTVEVERKGRNVFRRLVAYGIDWYIATILMNVLVLAAAYALTGTLWAGPLPLVFFDPEMQLVVLLGLVLIEVAYYCLVPLWIFPGQTLGKRLLRLRVVGKDGRRSGLVRMLVRDLFGIVLLEGCFSPLSNHVRNYLMLFLPEGIIRYTVWFSWAAGVLSILVLLFSRRSMLHDFVAGTVVETVPAVTVAVEDAVDGEGRRAGCGSYGSRQSADI